MGSDLAPGDGTSHETPTGPEVQAPELAERPGAGALRFDRNVRYEHLSGLARAITTRANLRAVRAIAQLQILTRVSYVILVVVPLLAATWPTVRWFINRHNDAAESAVERTRDARVALEAAMTDPSPSALRSPRLDSALAVVLRSATAAESVSVDYAATRRLSADLPWTLAVAFFAALFVALAHLAYQTLSPETIRVHSMETFTAERADTFAERGTDDDVVRAQEVLSGHAGRAVRGRDRTLDEKLLRHLADLGELAGMQLETIPRPRLRRLLLDLESGALTVHDADVDHSLETLVRAALGEVSETDRAQDAQLAIRDAAKAEYLTFAAQGPIGIVLAGGLYLLAIVLIVLLTKAHIEAVVSAAGWTGLPDLFRAPQ
jgi:hypothetical protein